MVQLKPMTPAEFETWLASSVKTYAEEKVRAGSWEAAGALERSVEDHEKLLPLGLASPDNYLYMLMSTLAPGEAPTAVGVLWFAAPPWKPPMAFVFDLLIYEPYRRRGYARQALRALEDKVRPLGLDTIGLHVFGHNHGARALYEQSGYEITDLQMAKKLVRDDYSIHS